jgi:sulfatase modifying factor 1
MSLSLHPAARAFYPLHAWFCADEWGDPLGGYGDPMGATEGLTQEGMLWVPGASFTMGSSAFYPEEGPTHTARVESLWVDRHPVTNDLFAQFVAATGYLTTAERPLDPALLPGLDDYSPGSMVFRATSGPVDLRNWRAWWTWVPGASWSRPRGPGSDLGGIGDHPVVQVSYADAASYATWAGKELPTEAEWEHAARGGLEGAVYAWGDDVRPAGTLMANTWQGSFPYENTGARGWVGTSPVGTFAPNGYGLQDVTGNVWEWTADAWSGSHHPPASPCCAPPSLASSAEVGSRVLKGGSHLCSPEYCLRYRPAARSPESEDTSTTHIGFRCVRRGQGPA